MRIVSRFHDYYDIGMGLGHDSSIDYIRTPREVVLQTKVKYESPGDIATIEMIQDLPRIPGLNSWDCFVIGFCGKFYPVITYRSIKTAQDKKVFCYSIEEADRQMQRILSTKSLDNWKKGSRWGERHSLERFISSFKELENQEPFIINRSPIVVMYERTDAKTYKACWNARLRDYNFEKVITPYEAFQSIEMFLSNLATPEKPIPPRSDLQKVQSHGFDLKMSFRKGKKE
jgi:hypothetical protein